MYNILRNGETKLVGKRTIVNLNGDWAVGDSIGADDMAAAFDHSCPVPSVISNATPPFEKAGDFQSSMMQACKLNWKMCTGGVIDLPVNEEAQKAEYGVYEHERNYFWYKKTFVAPERHRYADLIVLKARFGSKVWLNGSAVGESHSCFTSACYDVADVIKWGEENEIVIRVGAHQQVLPPGTLNMEDCEHELWYAGIWDDVEIYCYDGVKISSVQFATKINPKQVIVETELLNKDAEPAAITLTQTVKSADGSTVIVADVMTVELAADERKTVPCVIALPDAELWSPDDPNLYVLETATDGDSELNRFGVREAYFRTDTKRFYLNGEICFLRGGLMTLERFIEDPLLGTLPWDETWVRALIGESRRSVSWNMTKYCLCDPLRKWLEIADEEGLMGVPELPIWCFNPERADSFNGYQRHYNLPSLLEDVKQWVRDNRSHSSVIYWSAALETCTEWLGSEVIPLGRSLDLEKRGWLNSYGTPVGPDDPIENHPYKFTTNGLPDEWGVPGFDMLNLESQAGFERQSAIGAPGVASGHAQCISEYEWLWLTRKGEPGRYVANTYHKLPYPTETPQQRLELQNYLLAGMTEYWRAHRGYAQVMYNAWLAGDMGEACAVCDNYEDPRTLDFQPAFNKYVKESFKPLGTYLEFWKREVQAGENRVFYVMLINDYLERKEGEVNLYMKYDDGTILELGRRPFVMGANGSTTIKYDISMPEKLGRTEMIAQTTTADGLMTKSYRWVEVKEEIPPRPYGQW